MDQLDVDFSVAAQMSVPRWIRARALALYGLTFQGGTAIGSALWGLIAEHAGVSTALVCGGTSHEQETRQFALLRLAFDVVFVDDMQDAVPKLDLVESLSPGMDVPGVWTRELANINSVENLPPDGPLTFSGDGVTLLEREQK